MDLINKMETFTVNQLVELVHKLQIKILRSNKPGAIEIYKELEDLCDKLDSLDWDFVIDSNKFGNGKIIVKSLLFCDIINI